MISEFRAGAVLNDAAKIVGRHFVVLFSLTLLCSLPALLFEVFEFMNSGGVEERADPGARALGSLIGLICQALTTGALSYAVFQALSGQAPSLGDSLGAAMKRLLPLIGVAICSGLFIGVGFLLLIIPGIIFATMVYVASVACVVEGTGVFASMRRSRELSKGYRGTIFVILLMAILLAMLMGMAVGFAAVAAGSPLVIFVATTVLQLVISTWAAAAAVIAYYHLRSIKESIDVNDIVKVFE